MPWGKKPIPIGSKNPFAPNPFTGEEIPAHGNVPLNPGDHCSPKIDALWPTVFNGGFSILRGGFELYKNEWKGVEATAAVIDMKTMPLVEEGLRRIEYMLHCFAEYVWGLLMDLPVNMIALIDPDAALDKIESVMLTLQEFYNRSQNLNMSIGFLSGNLRNAGAVDPVVNPVSFATSQNTVIRHLGEIYEVFMGEQKANSFDSNAGL